MNSDSYMNGVFSPPLLAFSNSQAFINSHETESILYLQEFKDQSTKYDLLGAVVHEGNALQSGHYWAYVRRCVQDSTQSSSPHDPSSGNSHLYTVQALPRKLFTKSKFLTLI